MKSAIVVLLICAAMAHSKLRGNHKKDTSLHFTSGSFEMQNLGDQDYHLDMAEAEKWDHFMQQEVHGTESNHKAKKHHAKKDSAKVLLEVAPIQFVDLSTQTSLISVKETDLEGKPYVADVKAE